VNSNITVTETNDLGLNLVNAGTGDINIGVGGAMTDNNADQKNIIGDDVVLAAVNGIGSGNALETTINTLTATNTNNGIEILDEGGLTIAAAGIANTNGWVNITTLSPLNVNGNVTAGGNITLTASETSDSPAYGDDINVNANITSTGGNVELYAGDDINQAAGTTIKTNTAGRTITIAAAFLDQDNHGEIDSDGTIQTNNGDINISARDTIDLTTIVAGTGDVTVASNFGDININSVSADNLNASSEDGITVANSTITTFTGQVTGTGDINVNNETDSIVLAFVQTANGDITINAGGDIYVTSVSAIDHRVTLTSGDEIIDNNATATTDIKSNDLILDAVVGIGHGDAIDTEVKNLSARVTTTTGGNNIEIFNTGDLTLDDLAGWGYAVRNFGTGTIDIEVLSNLTIGSPVISGGGTIFLTATTGSILDANAANADISGPAGVGIQLIARDGIGNTGTIETDVTNLTAQSTTGPIDINEIDTGTSDGLTITKVAGGTIQGISTTGDVTLNVTGPLVQDDANNITSNGGNIDIDVASLTQNTNSKIDADLLH